MYNAPPDLEKLEEQLEEIGKEKESGGQNQEFEKAAQLQDPGNEPLRKGAGRKAPAMGDKKGKAEAVVTADDVARIVSDWTGIPVTRLAKEESERLLRNWKKASTGGLSARRKR